MELVKKRLSQNTENPRKQVYGTTFMFWLRSDIKSKDEAERGIYMSRIRLVIPGEVDLKRNNSTSKASKVRSRWEGGGGIFE